MHRKLQVILLHVGVLCAAAFLAWETADVIWPDMRECRMVREDGTTEDCVLPLHFASGDAEEFRDVTFLLEHRPLGPTHFHWTPDDCIEWLIINDRPVEGTDIPFCDYTSGRVLDLSEYLRHGENRIAVRIRNTGGPGSLHVWPAIQDPPVIVLAAAFAFLLGTACWVLLGHQSWVRGGDRILLLCAVLGLLLRAGYTAQTPWSVRGHDADGHVEYITYVAQHWKLPPVDHGWQSYQPPLYYVLAGSLYAAGNAAGLHREVLLRMLQGVSVLLSFTALFISIRILLLTLPHPRQKTAVRLGALLLATQPGLILSSARINNDVLVQTLMVAALFAGIQYALRPTVARLVSVGLLTGLALLTKSNALLLMPVMLGCMFVASHGTLRQRITAGAVACAISILMAGWLPLLRPTQHLPSFMVGNAQDLNRGLAVPTDAKTFLIFSPAAMLRHPYNDPWNDAERRAYFWEYFYRSAFFGEFRFPAHLHWLARGILLTSFLLTPLCLFGMRLSPRTERRWVWLMTGTIVTLFAGHLMFRLAFPYSSSQDFRYLALIAIPVVWLMVRGTTLRVRGWPWMTGILTVTHAVLCTAFVSAVAAGVT